jgi:sugar phosphate isomerase/epimerase
VTFSFPGDTRFRLLCGNIIKKVKELKVGIDNYGLFPLGMEPLEVLKWAKKNGAAGVQFSGLEPEMIRKIDRIYLNDLKQLAASENLYIEWGGAQHIPRDMTTWSKKDIFEINKKAAEEAEILGTQIIRSCSGGLMRWHSDSPMTETLISETAACLRSQKQMLKDHNVILSIEIHFEFTTHELLRLFNQCETEPGNYLGICLDTMNLLTMLEDPVQGTDRILPWVTSTHLKDGGILLTDEGMITFATEIGKGIIDLKKIAHRLAQLPYDINLSIEDHGGQFLLPIYEPLFLSKFPDLTAQEFAALVRMAKTAEVSMKQGKCTITEREKWPEVCETRMKRDIENLKRIISHIEYKDYRERIL